MKRDAPHVAELESSLFVASLIIQAQAGKLDTFERENAHLRVVAQKVSCPYGFRASNGACTLGYPGCGCMDDLFWATSYEPATGSEAYQRRLEQRAQGLQERVRIAASHFHSMAEGFNRNREPSKAAACSGMAALMEDRL
jgi:hypothetical protein